jgi:hypothetical protein
MPPQVSRIDSLPTVFVSKESYQSSYHQRDVYERNNLYSEAHIVKDA